MALIKSIVARDSFLPILALCGAILILLLIKKPYKEASSFNKTKHSGCLQPRTHPASTSFLGLPFIFRAIQAISKNQVPGLFCSIFDETGPEAHTVVQSLLGKDNYWTRDPNNIKHVLLSGFGDWELPYARTTAFLHCWGGGIFGADGQEWKESRALVRPAFKTGLIHDVELLERHVQHLIKRIPADEIVDLGDLFPLFTMDVATDILFNQSTGCLDPMKAVEGQMFASSFNYVMKQMSIHVTAPFTRYLYNPKLKQSTKFIFDFTDSFINRALQTQTKNKDASNGENRNNEVSFITRLSRINNSPAILRSELLSIMVAGRDTTAALLGILWWHISRRMDILEKLRAEIAHLNGRAPSVKELKGLGYLENLVNEVLRLYPINPVNSRTARCDTMLPRGGGSDGLSPLFIAKGQTVIFSSLALHRRRDIWGDDALELRPERWDSTKPTAWEYIPFGGGPRICLGQQLALLETGYATVRLLQEFAHISPIGENEFVESFAMALTSGRGCKVRLER